MKKKMEDDDDDDDDELPSCAICLQQYDESQHAPRVLYCGHSLCQSCIATLPIHLHDAASSSANPSALAAAAAASASSSASSASFSVSSSSSASVSAASSLLRCPECSQWTRLSYKGYLGLPKNIELLRLLGCLKMRTAEAKLGSKVQKKVSCIGNLHDSIPLLDGSGIFQPTEAGKSSGNCYKNSKSPEPLRSFGKLRAKEDGSASKDEIRVGNLLEGFAFYMVNTEKEMDGSTIPSIIPHSAIKLKEGSHSYTNGDFRVGEFSFVEGGRHKSYNVSLLQVGYSRHAQSGAADSDERDKEAGYKELIVSVWKNLSIMMRNELLLLMRLSFFCKCMCQIIGLWLGEQGCLFVVSKVSEEGESQSIWRRIMSKRSSMDVKHFGEADTVGKSNNCPTARNKSVDKVEAADGGQGIESLGETELSNTSHLTASKQLRGLSFNSRDGCEGHLHSKLIEIVQWALELCEIVMELHSEGITVGIFGLHCVTVDEYDHIMLHAASLLHFRKILYQFLTENSTSLIPESLGVLQNESILPLDSGTPIDKSLKFLWQSVSPEMLDIFGRKGKRSMPVLSSSQNENWKYDDEATSCSIKQLLMVITRKADVWSLAYSLVQLFSAAEISESLSFSETFQKVLIEKQKPDAWCHYDHDLQDFNNCINPVDLHEKSLLLDKSSRLQHLLGKCFEMEPEKRPEVRELWHVLKVLRSCLGSEELPENLCAGEVQVPSNASSLWCFGLEGLFGDGIDIRDNSQPIQQWDEHQENLVERDTSSPDEYEDSRIDFSIGALEAIKESGLDAVEVTNIKGHSDSVTALITCGKCFGLDDFHSKNRI
ncbi:hypothetical protein O6H91_Y457100 [Diphasiastrum complanatum]|nr:hypothetical protein O6H91_Y457100 [Diphasiastrum complanatum]